MVGSDAYVHSYVHLLGQVSHQSNSLMGKLRYQSLTSNSHSTPQSTKIASLVSSIGTMQSIPRYLDNQMVQDS